MNERTNEAAVERLSAGNIFGILLLLRQELLSACRLTFKVAARLITTANPSVAIVGSIDDHYPISSTGQL